MKPPYREDLPQAGITVNHKRRFTVKNKMNFWCILGDLFFTVRSKEDKKSKNISRYIDSFTVKQKENVNGAKIAFTVNHTKCK